MIRALIEYIYIYTHTHTHTHTQQWHPQMHICTPKLVYTSNQLLHISANYMTIIRDIMYLISLYFIGIRMLIATQLAEHVDTS